MKFVNVDIPGMCSSKDVWSVYCVNVDIPGMCVYCVNVDIPGMCSSKDVWSLWFTADTSGHTLLAVVPVEICCR